MVSRMTGRRLLLMSALCLAVAQAPAAAKKQLTWFMGEAGGMNTWTALARAYEQENPGVKITVINGNLDKFYAMITAGLMPDVWGPYGTPGIRADVNRNWAIELGPYIQRDAKELDLDDFFPGLMREFRVNGRQYALPHMNQQDYFFYNTEMYAQAGLMPPPTDSNDRTWNWDRLVENARKLTKLDSTGKIKVEGLAFERGFTYFPGWLHMWNAEPYSATALRSSVPQTMDLGSPEMVNALTKAHDLIYRVKVTKPDDVYQGFEQNRVAQEIKPGFVIGSVIGTKKLKWAITTNPWAVTNKGTMWPDGWRIGRVCKDKELAWDFIKFLCSKRMMTFFVNDPKGAFQGSGVARKSVFYDNLGQNIAKATGMTAADVFSVTAQVDQLNVVKYAETICLDSDMVRFLDPVMSQLWQNRLSPAQAATKLQDVANKRLPELFNRWLRNIRFTGMEK